MRAIKTLLIAGATVGLLAACGVLNTFVPDQTLTDPLGIDGLPVPLEPGAASAGLAAQQTTSQWSRTETVAVDDIDTSDIPDWIDPSGLFVDVGFEGTATFSSATAGGGNDFSDTFTFDAAALVDGSIADDETGATVSLPSFTTPAGATVELQKESCSGLAPVTCTYTATSGLEGFVIPVAIDGAQMDALYDILTSGAATNTTSLTIELTATGTAPGDTTITVTIDAPSGTLTF